MVVQGAPEGGGGGPDTPRRNGRLTRLGEDWWATILAGVITALAVAGVLPKIPW